MGGRSCFITSGAFGDTLLWRGGGGEGDNSSTYVGVDAPRWDGEVSQAPVLGGGGGAVLPRWGQAREVEEVSVSHHLYVSSVLCMRPCTTRILYKVQDAKF